jgi:hypothetical protein
MTTRPVNQNNATTNADIDSSGCEQTQQVAPLFDHLVGAQYHRDGAQ